MLRVALLALAGSFVGLSYGAEPVLANERVIVWDTTSVLPAAKHDFVAVSLSQLGSATFGHQGEVPSKGGTRTIVIEQIASSLGTSSGRRASRLACIFTTKMQWPCSRPLAHFSPPAQNRWTQSLRVGHIRSRDRTHSEVLSSGQARAIILELK